MDKIMVHRWLMFMMARFVTLIVLAGMVTACAQTSAVSTTGWDSSYTATTRNVPDMGPSAGIF